MERILNDEEKIRRAEEIYFKRNNAVFSDKKNEVKKTDVIKTKIFFDILIMLNLTIIVFGVKNKEFIFTKEFMEELGKYNNKISLGIINVFENIFNEKSTETDYKVENHEENIVKEEDEKVNVKAENIIVENNFSTSSISEMELDIQNLKGAYKLVNPLTSGVVSSSFGARESKYQKVTGYHTGIDIAADEGTTIVAAMEGIVENVSSQGDYGKHVKIRCNNIYTLYAHCSKIFVKEGQIVAIGQKIANVGNTGNSTGPHLHFEIRVENRFVDPAKIIDF